MGGVLVKTVTRRARGRMASRPAAAAGMIYNNARSEIWGSLLVGDNLSICRRRVYMKADYWDYWILCLITPSAVQASCLPM